MATFKYALRKKSNQSQIKTATTIYQGTIPFRSGKGRNQKHLIKILASILTFMIVSSYFSTNLFAQTLKGQKNISGLVTEENGIPVMGVKISTIPSDQSTYSDAKGNFSLTITSRTKKINFLKTGYVTRTVNIKTLKFPVHIQLKSLSASDSAMVASGLGLEDVVVVGYGNHSREQIIGSAMATAPKMRTIKGRRVNNLKEQLTGLAGPSRGVIIQNNGYFEPSTESYAHEKENGFKATASAPFSTFSVDVDKASYSNVRRFIRDGHLPPTDAVRIEELINYFDYHYGNPQNSDPINIKTELSSAPWNPAHYLLQIGLQTKKVSGDDLPPSNLVFLIDVSGSMASSNKLPLLVSSFKMLTDQLRDQDYVSIVTYAGMATDVLKPTNGSHKKAIKAALDQLVASGSTNGAGGLEKAYVMAEKHFRKNGNNRIILASDGDFNVGARSLSDLENLITEKRKSGIYLSVLGFGMGNYKDDKMELLADKGNGNYAYIDNSSEARRILLKEFGGTLFTAARDVKVQVQFNPALVKAYRLVGYENRALADEDFNRDTVDAAEMGNGSTVTALYEIIPQGVKDEFTPKIDTLRYVFSQLPKTGGGLHKELGLVSIRYKDPKSIKSKLLSHIVADNRTAFNNTSADFQLAAAAASWGMLLKNSPYKQKASYDLVAGLLKQPLAADKTGQVGELLDLVQTSQALKGNEVNENATGTRPPIFRPRPRPYPHPLPHPKTPLKRKKPMVMKILPVNGSRSINYLKADSALAEPVTITKNGTGSALHAAD